ncbi:hypothetical protein QTH91_12475 [Variovorax dokdonensis]|uniref:Uncharacterized protein n=1 Tax=Variovorax dokdonensis TaxID=344883 RepID=A0ABT7NBI2_9BURK|nr:hypothetical protein [Variovorax dokdonensis]MDM0045302.1 hypothetical protein [Variovorax dokdonensis]
MNLQVPWRRRGAGFGARLALAVAGVLLIGPGGSVVLADELPEWLDKVDGDGSDRVAAAPVPSTESPRRQRWFVESSAYRLSHDAPASHEYRGNLGLDVQATETLGAGWNLQLGGRVDVDGVSTEGRRHQSRSLTLRELYASRQVGALGLNVGRINVRDGVSPNFNPSDVFRTGALTARRTENPTRLKESRLGVVGLRAQTALGGGSLSAMLVPHLDTSSTPHWYDPQWGAVNGGQSQAYVMYTPPGLEGIYANVLAHQQQDGNSTFGLNVSKNLGQAWVASLEMASTRRSRFADLAQSASPSTERYGQAALALSYTTETRQTLTLEYDYNGGGLTPSEWAGRWQGASVDGLQRAMNEASRRQEPLGGHADACLSGRHQRNARGLCPRARQPAAFDHGRRTARSTASSCRRPNGRTRSPTPAMRDRKAPPNRRWPCCGAGCWARARSGATRTSSCLAAARSPPHSWPIASASASAAASR